MLDFGMDMQRRSDSEEQDDLFDGIQERSVYSDGSEDDAALPDAEMPPASDTCVEDACISDDDPACDAIDNTHADDVMKNTEKVQEKIQTREYSEKKMSNLTENHPAKEQGGHSGLRNNPHFLNRKRKSEEFSDEDKREVSHILREARRAAGLTEQDVENATQIRLHYISALENAEYDNLPQSVYVLAYLRKLCELYNISKEEADHLVKPWRNIPRELPDTDKLTIQQDSDNTDRRLMQRVEIMVLAAAAIIVIGVIALITVLIVSFFSGEDVPEASFDNADLLELQPPPSLDPAEFPKVQEPRR